MRKSQPTQPDKAAGESTDFFETLSMTADHYIFHDDTVDTSWDQEVDNYALLNESDVQSEIKTTAIITLVLVLITSVALGLIVWRGLTSLQNTTNSTNATSYEL